MCISTWVLYHVSHVPTENTYMLSHCIDRNWEEQGIEETLPLFSYHIQQPLADLLFIF